MTEQELNELDLAVLIADGWKHCGQDSHCKPKHRQSLDYPGEMLDDFNAKGPHPGIQSPDGKKIFNLCGCQNDFELPQPTRDPAEAMRLLMKYRFELSPDDQNWFVTRMAGTGSDGDYDFDPELTCGKTPMIAVCRAVVAINGK